MSTQAVESPSPRRHVRRGVRVLAGLLLLGLLGAGAWLIALHLLAEHHLHRAKEALKRQRYPEALGHLEQALRFRPRSARLHLLAARTARRAGQVKQAWAHLARCRQLYGGETEEEQLEHLLIRVQLGELDKVPLLTAYVTEGRPEAGLVLEAYTRAYFSRRLFAPLEACLVRWRELEPDNVEALIYEGAWHGQRGNTIGALESFSRALELDPERHDVRLRLAAVLLEQTKFREALAHFGQVHRATGQAEALLGLAKAHLGLGELRRASACLDQLLQENPEHAEGLFERGRLTLEQGRVAQAECDLLRSVRLDPYSPQARHNLAKCLRRLGRVEEADAQERREADLIRTLLRMDEITQRELPAQPSSPDLYCELAMLALKLGRAEQGRNWLATALERDPAHQPSRQLLAEHFQDRGGLARAVPAAGREGMR
jgi:tetratricopeptide (TPR) repeat protein